MYAPHHTIPHLVKYSTALTEITEHCRAYFRLFRTLLNKQNHMSRKIITGKLFSFYQK